MYYYGVLPRQMEIDGKVALVTGASEGIGAACAESFRRRGAKLSLTARSADKLRQVGGADALTVAGDLTHPDTRRRVVSETLSRFGRIDILINNAGVGLYLPAWKAPLADVRAMFELNFFAALEMVQLVAPHMQRQRSGTIVNISSIAGKVTLPWLTLYSSSKFALGSLTDGMRMELRRDGIHTMSVCPGYVTTGFQSHVLAGTVPESVGGSRTFVITAQQCAEAIAQGVERGSRTVVTPRAGWLFVMIQRLLPGLVDRQLERYLKAS